MWAIYAILSAVTAALVAIFGKIGLNHIDSTLATTLRSVVMAAFLLVAASLFGKFAGFHFSNLAGRDWMFIILAGIAGALSWLFYFLALKNGVTTAVVAIDRMSLVFVAILSVLFLGQSFTWKLAAGVVLMVGGALLVAFA